MDVSVITMDCRFFTVVILLTAVYIVATVVENPLCGFYGFAHLIRKSFEVTNIININY